MAKSLTAKDVILQVEHSFGRQPEKYMMRLINDALLDIGSKKQHYTVSAKQDLVPKQRWYTLSDNIIDIIRVEIKDTNNRYVMIPKLSDPHNLLRADTDDASNSLM
tara:strand:- start:5171 stop:5488 length:318 start_codon:yes stop_codon:yes gene_type:complete